MGVVWRLFGRWDLLQLGHDRVMRLLPVGLTKAVVELCPIDGSVEAMVQDPRPSERVSDAEPADAGVELVGAVLMRGADHATGLGPHRWPHLHLHRDCMACFGSTITFSSFCRWMHEKEQKWILPIEAYSTSIMPSP